MVLVPFTHCFSRRSQMAQQAKELHAWDYVMKVCLPLCYAALFTVVPSLKVENMLALNYFLQFSQTGHQG